MRKLDTYRINTSRDAPCLAPVTEQDEDVALTSRPEAFADELMKQEGMDGPDGDFATDHAVDHIMQEAEPTDMEDGENFCVIITLMV